MSAAKGPTKGSPRATRSKAKSRRAGDRAAIAQPMARVRRMETGKAQVPPTRKGSKSRDNLKAAALRALEDKGYRNLRLTDIAKEAKVNISLVYHYFHDKADLVYEALRDVVNVRAVIDSDDNRPHDPFMSLFYANKLFADFYHSRPGLIRSLVHFDEEHPQFHSLYSDINRNWCTRIAQTIQKRCPDADLTQPEAIALAYAMGSMVDKFLFELYVERNVDLATALPTTEHTTYFLTILWYRALYLKNPSTAELGPFKKLSKLKLTLS